ncbi:MAG TPA: hypothetical protein VHS52_06740 [Acidimicrobiales bacterium]|jgi:uncharacterized protein HemX|nr:hypothetical protein [Acidimicrobiales bacterium]
MVRRLLLAVTAFTVIAIAAIAGGAPATSAQTTTTQGVAPSTTPTTVPPTATPPTTRERATTTVASSTSTSSTSTSTTSTTVAGAGNGGSGISGKTIALILGAIAVLVLAGVVIALLIRQRDAQRWADEAAQAAAEGRSVLALATRGLATLDQPAAAARTWSDLEVQGARLHQRFQALSRRPPEDWLGAAVARADQALQALRSGTDADRALRLGPPPPTSEQLGYSEAVVRQRTADFEQELGALDANLARHR